MAEVQEDLPMVDLATAESTGKPMSARSDDSEGVFFISLHYKGAAYEVPIEAGEAVSSIFDFVQEVLDFPRENCKLICRGKLLRPDDAVHSESAANLGPGSKVMLMATSEHDKSFVQSSRPDPLVKGFAEEERDEQSRRKRAKAGQVSAWGTKQDQEFCFASIKAEFKYSTPPPFEAEALLKKLSTDPGIIEIMKTRHFRVGILTEMSPVEAQERMANRGTPNMDLLGYNQNAGDKIVLRLRTDSLKGFRPYHDLINTLIHELTHNVWGPHDNNFWKLYGELKAQYMKFHRFWSHGGRAADSNTAGQFGGFAGDDAEMPENNAGFGQVLGTAGSSDVPLTAAQRRERAAAAASVRTAAPFGEDEEDLDLEDQQPPQEVNGGVSVGGFDFLKSGGGWVIACPCGQQHPINQCPEDFVASLEGDAPCVLDPVPEAPAAAMEVDEGKVSQSPEDALADDFAAGAAAPSAQVGGSASSTSAASAQEPATADVPMTEESLSADQLQALGLDGAAVWIQSFSEKLRVMSRSGHPAAHTAVETLHRLVQNIMDHPGEQKFRRVKANNPKIQAKLLGLGEDAEKLMALLGFEAVVEDGERVLAIRDSAFDSVRLRLGQEVLERHIQETAVVQAH
mmetsp:Transcript_53389/g.125009  ORF Transcript_53389/g.125009 Transcript_53389/m.125009 type:complete len:626 (+) Transcript_53389:56-1933(+)